MESIASLEASAAVWEFWGYVATGAVFIGALIESIVTFWPRAIKNETVKERVGKGASLLLIAGVAGELLTQVSTNILNERIIALLHRETALLEAVIAPRRLSADQQKTAIGKWKRFAGDKVAVTTNASDLDGAMLGRQLVDCLTAAGITPLDHVAGTMPLGSIDVGITVSGLNEPLVWAIIDTLRSAGIDANEGPEKYSDADVGILVGIKPLPAVPQVSK